MLSRNNPGGPQGLIWDAWDKIQVFMWKANALCNSPIALTAIVGFSLAIYDHMLAFINMGQSM